MIAPSGPFDLDGFADGVAWLRERFHVTHRADIFERQTFLAGTDARRREELRDALGDPAVDAILTARGGYGASRIVGDIRAEEVRAANKPIIGFSDVTALHALWRKARVPSIHGPMLAWLGSHVEARDGFLSALRGDFPPRELKPLASMRDVDGVLVGGNLAVLASLAGTDCALDCRDALLVLEDIGEAPYRIDRALTQLRAAGCLDGVRGVLLGDFVGADKSIYGATVEGVMAEHFECPVFTGLRVGHAAVNDGLPLGVRARVVSGRFLLDGIG